MARHIGQLLLAFTALIAGTTPAAAQSFLLSRNPANAPADHDSVKPRVSADGKRVVFASKSKDILPGDTSGKWHVYLWDGRARPVPVISRLSVDRFGIPANRASENPVIPPDGNWVAFNSAANDLDLSAPDSNGWSNVYVLDLAHNQLYWASRALDDAAPNLHCGSPTLSDTLTTSRRQGSETVSLHAPRVAFSCLATNMVAEDTNNVEDIFFVDVADLMLNVKNKVQRVEHLSIWRTGSQWLQPGALHQRRRREGGVPLVREHAGRRRHQQLPGRLRQEPRHWGARPHDGPGVRPAGRHEPAARHLCRREVRGFRIPSLQPGGRHHLERQVSRLQNPILPSNNVTNALVSVDANGQPDPAGGRGGQHQPRRQPGVVRRRRTGLCLAAGE